MSRAHQVQHSAVLRNLVLLELIDSVLPVVHSDELQQHIVLLDHFVVLRDVLLERQDVGLLGVLRLEEITERHLACLQLAQLFLIVSFLALESLLARKHVLAAFHRIDHTRDVKHLAADPQSSLQEWILELACYVGYLVAEFARLWVRQHSLLHLIVTVVLNS